RRRARRGIGPDAWCAHSFGRRLAPAVLEANRLPSRECVKFDTFRAISAKGKGVRHCDIWATACGILGVMRRSARTWVVVVILGCVLAGGAYALTRPGKGQAGRSGGGDRKSTRLNSSHR